MVYLTDGKETVGIALMTWDESCGEWSNDISGGFFQVGSLEFDVESDAYIVHDVGYCIEQADEWRDGVGDYSKEGIKPDDRLVVLM